MPEPASPSAADPDEVFADLLAQALQGRAAADEARALAEVAEDLAALADAPLDALRPDVRAAVLAAWTTRPAAAPVLPLAARAEPPTATPLAPRGRAPATLHLLRWAALLVVGLGVTLLAVLSSPDEATAGLRLGTFFRLDQAGGRQEAASGRRIPWGERLGAEPGEVLGFRLPDGSAVVLRDGGAVRLVQADDGGAVLAVESGSARVAVGDAGSVRLAVGRCRVALTEGRAWVSAEAGLLALGPTGRGRLEIPGVVDRILTGPLEARCASTGDLEVRATVPDPELFRMPSVLAADHLGRAPGRLIAARQWRVVGGEARRHGTSIQPGASGARFAWRPSPDVRRAHTLRLHIEGAAGLEVAVADGAAVPAGRGVDLALPAGWYARLAASGDELVLALRWTKAGGTGARFLGASFLSDDEFHAAEAADGSSRRE